jgi:hypothetical protein
MTENPNSRLPYKPGDPEYDLFGGVVMTLIGVITTGFEYWKPSWSSNETKMRLFRSLVGDRAADIIVYCFTIPFIIAGILLLWSALLKFQARSRRASTENEEQSQPDKLEAAESDLERSNNGKCDLFVGVPLILVGLISTGFQYWKPNWWWNSSRVKLMRSIAGDWRADIFFYNFTIIFIFFGALMLWSALLKFRASSDRGSIENE